METEYDYLIVGSGMYGSVLAHELNKQGKKVIVVEKREHIGGNCYTDNREGINVHVYGLHIFHTNKKEIWDYMQQFCEMKPYILNVKAKAQGKIYNLPFNMHTFEQVYGVKTVEEAKKVIQEEINKVYTPEPKNLKEHALNMVGEKIFKLLIEGYTEKQWHKKCEELPPFIIKRLPFRFEYNNNYFNDAYSGIPIGGYTKLFENMLKGIEVKTGYDYLKHKGEIKAKKIIFSGPIDQYFDYCYGPLEYRSLRFESETVDKPYYQDTLVYNYTDKDVPYTRIVEHKYFEQPNTDKTIVTREYPADWKKGDEPYYPINDDKNNSLYNKYLELANQNPNVVFRGRLGAYRYNNMDTTVEMALDDIKNGI